PDQGNAVSALDDEIHIAKNFFRTVGLRDPDKLRDVPAARLRLGKRKVNSLLFFRQFDALDFFQLLDPALHLLRLGGLIAEAIDEYFQLFNALALITICGLELLLPLGLLR